MANLHRVLAVAFLVVLLAEWGSHSLAFAHSALIAGENAVHIQHGDHDDLCKTLVKCPDGPRKELPSSNGGHDVLPQNPAINRLGDADSTLTLGKDTGSYRPPLRVLSRSVSPPFHPPELS